MEQHQYIHPGLSNQQNKRLVLEDLKRHSPTFKTHSKKRLIKHNRSIPMAISNSRTFETAFKSLEYEGAIEFIPSNHIIIKNFNQCPCGSTTLIDLTAGWGNNRHYQCTKCERYQWKNVWWKKDHWLEHTKKAFKL